MVAVETGWDDHRVWTPASRLSHRHRTADAVRARFIASGQHDPAGTRVPDQHGSSSQRRIVELLNRRIERIHVGMSDDPRPSAL